ncbi:MAG: hypothetical protein ACJAV2_005157, partial [Myxococcota bacterium]
REVRSPNATRPVRLQVVLKRVDELSRSTARTGVGAT